MALQPPKNGLTRKLSGVLRKGSIAPPLVKFELPATATMNPWCPTDTLSLRCTCGYIKHDVMCLGDIVDKEAKLFHFCGGLFIVKSNGVECAKCRKTSKTVTFNCAFCGKTQNLPIRRFVQSERISLDSVHSTILFNLNVNNEEEKE